jgi:hypothetical protein
MERMEAQTTGIAESGSSVSRLDHGMLVSNVASGAFWLILLAIPAGVWLVGMGALYVIGASLFLAAVYAREPLSRGQMILAGTIPWLAAVALWTWLAASIDGSDTGSDLVLSVWFGVLLGTACFAAWQTVAFLARHFWFPDSISKK